MIDETMAYGIILNGTSSSGKTTIANGFLKQYGSKFKYLSIDNHILFLIDKLSELYPNIRDNTKEIKEAALKVLFPGFIYSFHDLIAAHLAVNQSIIVDHVLQEPEWRNDLFKKIEPFNTIMVGVFCPLDVIEERERKRGDRNIGTAKYQYEKVHIGCKYNLNIETNKMSQQDCIAKLIKYCEQLNMNVLTRL